MITNDSGLYHIAASFKIPMISLRGPGRPEHYADTGYQGWIVLFFTHPIFTVLLVSIALIFLPCRGNNVCMKSIPPKEVYIKRPVSC